MPFATTDDGVKLYYEEASSGEPIIFVHEFAGDHRSWEPQMRYFSRRYRCIVYNARGYPPSDVPDDFQMYSQRRAADDIKAVLDHLGIARAHIVGLSMGGFATLHFGLHYPGMARSLVVGGAGLGAEPETVESFRRDSLRIADEFEARGADFAREYAAGPVRVQYQNKDPRGWREFADLLAEHSALGAANTMRGVQARRPSLWALEAELSALTVPTLIMLGDEDESCLIPGVYLKRTIPSSGLVVIPKSGHTLNIEEPEAFNRALIEFFAQVEAGRWGLRDPRSLAAAFRVAAQAED